MTRNSSIIASLVVILLLGWALRVSPLGQNRFLEDEALYAYWGLQISTGQDPMLDFEPVDKPPLHAYALALSHAILSPRPVSDGIQTVWAAELAARLPSLFASVTAIALVFALGRQLYQDAIVGMLAALLLAVSPFDILFASTAFTDPLMTALALGAMLCASRGRMARSGMLLGLSAATKQQGIFFLPIVVAFGLLSRERVPKNVSLAWDQFPGEDMKGQSATAIVRRLLSWTWDQRWIRFFLGFLVVAAGVFLWDSAREQRPGFLEQSLVSYGGLGPARPPALGDRAVEWLRLLAGFWVSRWYNGLLLCAVMLWVISGYLLKRAMQRPGKTDVVLMAFVLSFLALHWLVGFQTWDRYLLGLVPLTALLAARALAALGSGSKSRTWRVAYSAALAMVMLLTLPGPVLRATRSEVPFGGDHGAYDGIEDMAAFLRTTPPPNAVLYHQWLGYHYRFYLFPAPLRLHWYPDLADLVLDADIYRREPRYIAFPSWREGSAIEEALADAGISLNQVYETKRRDGTISFRLYRLEGP